GGYYTQEEVKEIVRYAAERYITVIPEIEMPGHSSAAIAAYPFLSCFPEEETVIKRNASVASQAKKGKKVQETWGVFEDVFVPSEQTFQFLQDVIDEIVPLFPSKYIHIGGDECPKEAWKRSTFCQQLIKEKGLKDEHELQSYFIRRMEQYINSKGKQIIGWDEILEGGLAPNATVMSWRGEQGGIDAARQRHDVIMSPNSHCYLDHSQTRNEDSVTIGGYTTIDKLYSYDPMPAALKGTEFEQFVKGVQGNVWTEYMRSAQKVEYMIFPRLAALSEAAWTQQANKQWNDFANRIPAFLQKLDRMQTQYSRAFFEINSAIVPAEDGSGIRWKLDSRYPNARIMVTPPGGTPMAYQQPLAINTSGTWQAVLQEGNKTLNTVNQSFNLHKATGRSISVTPKTARQYSGQGGVQGLVNGVTSQHGLSSNEWCGWQGADVEAVIDMAQAQPISKVVVHTIEATGSWIHRPARVEVMLSADGTTYAPAGSVNCKELPASGQGLRQVEIPMSAANARYIKVLVKHAGTIPAGMEGAGNPAWLFIDEIEVR
ncbi:MAG: family 20 glycosylhydrolase, partial [Chitinophagaceae bacterium]|nr:family 20 glycosylhydrolase [Chitinophagaceae bacterium]